MKTETVTSQVKVKAVLSIPDQTFIDLLCTADPAEGPAISYWARRVRYFNQFDHQESHPNRYDAPMNGGHLTLEEYDCDLPQTTIKEHSINLDTIRKGIQTLADAKYPNAAKHLSQILTDNIDVETADIFIQLCIFGEIKYC